jgi:guanine deaminase
MKLFISPLDCCRALGSSLVHPVVTPRFVPTCSPQLLARLGALAQRHGCHVQSHISESLDNDAFVAHLHPEVASIHSRLDVNCHMAA